MIGNNKTFSHSFYPNHTNHLSNINHVILQMTARVTAIPYMFHTMHTFGLFSVAVIIKNKQQQNRVIHALIHEKNGESYLYTHGARMF